MIIIPALISPNPLRNTTIIMTDRLRISQTCQIPINRSRGLLGSTAPAAKAFKISETIINEAAQQRKGPTEDLPNAPRTYPMQQPEVGFMQVYAQG